MPDFVYRVAEAIMYIRALAMLSIARFFPGSEHWIQQQLFAGDHLMRNGNPFKRK